MDRAQRKSRYGLAQTKPGSRAYRHRSGAVVVRTGGWEGARSGDLQRWEIGSEAPDGAITVGNDGRLFKTLREAAEALDATP